MTTVTLNPGYFSSRSALDWGFAVLALLGTVFAFTRYQHAMDVYEQGILIGTLPAVIWLAWFWRPLRTLVLVVTGLSFWPSTFTKAIWRGQSRCFCSSISCPASRPFCG
jgi:hypothetical protein